MPSRLPLEHRVEEDRGIEWKEGEIVTDGRRARARERERERERETALEIQIEK